LRSQHTPNPYPPTLLKTNKRPSHKQLLRVDGAPVLNLAHAAALMEAAGGPFVKLELEWSKVCAVVVVVVVEGRDV
jgi:hypothetical protein